MHLTNGNEKNKELSSWLLTSTNSIPDAKKIERYLKKAETLYDKELTHATQMQLALEQTEDKLFMLGKTIAELKAALKKNNHTNKYNTQSK
ncbi:MAG: hypothetical protein AAGG80_06110 [Pseudomonadota bacterium]